MVAHQHVGVDSGPKALTQLRQQLKKVEPVRIIPEQGLSLVAPGGDVITAAGPLDAQCACHRSDQNGARPKGQALNVKC